MGTVSKPIHDLCRTHEFAQTLPPQLYDGGCEAQGRYTQVWYLQPDQT